MNKRHLLKVALLLIILLLTNSILFTISNAEENRCEDIETLGEPTYSEKVVVKTRNMVKSRVLSANSEISPSKQTSHSKADIIQKFNEAKYTLTNETTYETEPILAGPNYREGTLTSLARQDTLKQLNFYRYLAGVNDVTIYEEMLSNNAKGSVLLSVSNFSHYPSKPADMSEEFYKYALYGTSYPPYSLSGYSSSGNIAEGTNMILPKSIKGYMDDTFNVVSNSVGHRLSIMCPYAQKTSFGCAPSSNYENVTCSTVTMYNQFGMTTEDTYYTWPPAGYCPIEVTDSNEMWSITLGGNLSYNTSNMEITLKCDGKEYRIDNSKILDSSYYNSFYFSLPEELIRIIDGGDFYLSGKKVEVDIKNGVYQGSEVIDLSYSTEFFSVEPIPVTSMKIYQKDVLDESNWYSSFTYLEGYTGDAKELLFQIQPEDATDTRYAVGFSDNSIASYNKSNRVITFNKGGTTKCTISLVSNPSIKKEFNITVYNRVNSINFENTTYNVDVGKTIETKVNIFPEDNVLSKDKIVLYTIEDESIATVDSNGKITGIKEGSTILTAKINENVKTTASVKVNKLIYTTIESEKIEDLENEVLKFDSKTLLTALTSELFPILNSGYSLSVCDKDGNIKSNTENIGSRNIIKILDNKGNVILEYIVIVKGDITGNGKTELFDSFKILINCLTNPDSSNLDSIDKIIRDFNDDGSVTLFDAFKFLIASLQS